MDRSKSTPAPIFNHRKRPRQAVIADPQDTNGNSKYTDLMPVSGFNGGSKVSNTGQGFKRFSSFNNSDVSEKGDNWGQSYQNGNRNSTTQSLQQKTFGNNNQGQGQNLYRQQNNSSSSSSFNQGCFNSYMNPKGAAYGSVQQEKQGGNSNFPSFNGGVSNYNKMTCAGQNRAPQQNRYPNSTLSSYNKQTNYNQQTSGNRNQYGQQMSGHQSGGPLQQNNRGYSNNNQNSYPGNQNNQPCHRGNQLSNQNSYHGNGQSNQNSNPGNQSIKNSYHGNPNSQSNNIQSFRNNQQIFKPMQQNRMMNQTGNNRMNDGRSINDNRFNSSIQNKGGIPVDNSPARGSVFPNQTFTTQTSDNKNLKIKKTSQSQQKIDPSLHVLTVSISRVMYWSKYRDNINMIFEVFGVLDSAVTRHPSGSCKEFKLRDEQFQINCVFYEIDRDLPKLIRGHWYRCMGTYDIRNALFKCVSVRMATVEEGNCCREQTEVTNIYLSNKATKS